MDQLVAGGLLVLGVIFLVAVVFVVRSEPETPEKASVPQQPASTAQEEPKTPDAPDIPDKTLFPIEASFPSDESATPVIEKDAMGGNTWHALANGQLYELLNELQSMRSQAQDLEHRLSTLIDVVQRVDKVQNGRFPIEEDEVVPSADTQLAH